MLRTSPVLAGLLLLAPATASADAFGELPCHPVKGPAMCLQATGAPGELIRQTQTTAELLTAGPTGLTPGATLPTDGALDCVDVAAWPGGGGLVAFPVGSSIDNEVWARGFLREPGQGWGEPVETLPPETLLRPRTRGAWRWRPATARPVRNIGTGSGAKPVATARQRRQAGSCEAVSAATASGPGRA